LVTSQPAESSEIRRHAAPLWLHPPGHQNRESLRGAGFCDQRGCGGRGIALDELV
jgi:hypothetical protein